MISTWYAKYVKGEEGVVAEVMSRVLMGKPITHSWFRRCCRRNGVGSINTKAWLYEQNIAYSSENKMHLREKPEFHTYSQWQLRGFQVMKGNLPPIRTILETQYFTDTRWWKNDSA